MYIAIKTEMSKTRKEEYADATRAALLESGRTLFAEHGYHNTSVDEICRHARVTKGALYHHYRNKEDLFADLVESLEADVVGKVSGSINADGDLWSALLGGIDLFLDHCTDPAYRRIVLVDGPNVLGQRRLAEIGERTASGLLKTLFEALMADGTIAKQPTNILVRLCLSVLVEGGLIIGESRRPKKAKQDVRAMIIRFLESLKT